MCTIDPLMCWYYDNLDFWEAHPEKLDEFQQRMEIEKGLPFNLIASEMAKAWRRDKKSYTQQLI